MLHPAEIYLLQEAINYIKIAANKTVLVDILARTKDGLINDNGDIHTVVLFKNPNGKIIVIDPSNSSLSSHIADSYNIDIFSGIDFCVPKREVRIYEGDKESGYRDCVDIAVKIASGLQKHGGGGVEFKKIIVGDEIEKVIDFGSIQVMQEVTNDSTLNPNFLDSFGVAKIRQASDTTIRQKVCFILPILKTEQQFIDSFKPEISEVFQEKCKDIFDSANTNGEYENCVVELLAVSGVPTSLDDFVC